MNYLGRLYDEGWGVPVNKEKAVECYAKAAKNGYADAQNNLANSLYSGQGIAEDEKEALYWAKKSVEQGCEEAKALLIILEDS